MTEENDEFNDEFISKSQRKREAQEIQGLGQQLVELPAKVLNDMPLPPEVREAVDHAREIRSHGALKRQLQYLGKVMRGVDVEPIRLALARHNEHHHQHVAEFHAIEQWRDRLIEETDAALGELLGQYAEVDIQHLRQLIRNAQRELKAGKPPKSKRAIFQYLKQIIIE